MSEDTERKPLEEYISAILNLDETERKARWLKGDILIKAKADYPGKGFARTMGAELGYTARYIHELVKVAATFGEELRDFNYPWELYRVCARTQAPQMWLDRSVSNQWSVRQLRQEILKAKDTGDEAARIRARGERLFRTVSEFIQEEIQAKAAQVEQAKRLWLALGEYLEQQGAIEREKDTA